MFSRSLPDRTHAQATSEIHSPYAIAGAARPAPSTTPIQRQQHGQKRREQPSQETQVPSEKTHLSPAVPTKHLPVAEKNSQEKQQQIDEYI